MSLSKSLIIQTSSDIKSENNSDTKNKKEKESYKNQESPYLPTSQNYHKRTESFPKINEIKLPKLKKAKEILGEIYRYKSEHGPLFYLTNSQNEKANFNNNSFKKQKNINKKKNSPYFH